MLEPCHKINFIFTPNLLFICLILNFNTILEPVESVAYIVGARNSTVVASLSHRAVLRCLAGGYPKPVVTWWRGDRMLPFQSDRYEITREFSLVINRVELYDLGSYVCQAYNMIKRPVSIQVTLMARGPVHGRDEDSREYLQYIVDEPIIPTTVRSVVTYPPQRPTPIPFIPTVHVIQSKINIGKHYLSLYYFAVYLYFILKAYFFALTN